MNRYLDQLRAFYTGLDDRQRRMLFVASAVALMAIVAVGAWSTHVPYQTLLTGRDYDDVLKAAGALDEAEIPYQVTDDGALSVPRAQLGRASAAVAAVDVLPGLQDVAELKLGLTPQAQQWAFIRAKEGDIARMLASIDDVSAAQVSIVPREESLYFGEERPASAAVFLKLTPGAEMGPGQVRAIINLVAGAVDGLDSTGVTVADDRGTLLAEGGVESVASRGTGPAELLEYQTQVERRYERSVTQALLPVLGYGADFSVTAAVDLDLTSTETQEHRIEVDRQAIVSERLDESTSAKDAPGGVPGVDANLPERASESAASSSGSMTERNASTTNFDYPTVDEITRRPAGGLKRVSVAVQVNEARVADLAAAALGVEEASEDDVRMLQERIREAVHTAVGYDSERKDMVTVSFIPFAEREWVDESDATLPAWAESSMPYALALVGMLLAFFVVARPLVRAVTLPAAMADEVDGEEDDVEEPMVGEETSSELSERLRVLVDNYESVDSGDLNRLIEKEAEVAAQVLRMWHRS